MFDLMRENQQNLMLVLCGVCATAGFLLIITRFLPTRRKKILIILETIAFFLLWFDRKAYIYSGDASALGYLMVRVSNFAVFFLTPAMVEGFNLYISDWLLHEGEMKSVPRRLKFVQYMSMIGMLMAVVSAFADLYYYFDDMNVYHRGDGFLIAYIIPICCPLIQFSVVRDYKDRFRKMIYRSICYFIFVPLIFGTVQIFTTSKACLESSMLVMKIIIMCMTSATRPTK